MLRRQIGFQWRNTSCIEECQVSGKLFQADIGFVPVIADVPGLSHVFIAPSLLEKYAPAAYATYQQLRTQFHPSLPRAELEAAPEGIAGISTLEIPQDAPELDAVYALMADEVIQLCVAAGVVDATEEGDDVSQTDISPMYYIETLASYGFVFETIEAETKAIALLTTLVTPVIYAQHCAKLGEFQRLENALTVLARYGYVKHPRIQEACSLLDAFV